MIARTKLPSCKERLKGFAMSGNGKLRGMAVLSLENRDVFSPIKSAGQENTREQSF